MVQRRTEPGTPAWHASRFFPRPVDLTRSRVPVLNAVGTVVERARAWAGDTIHELRVDSPLPCRREQPGGSRAPLPLPWTARVAPHTCVRTVDSYSYLFLLRLRMSAAQDRTVLPVRRRQTNRTPLFALPLFACGCPTFSLTAIRRPVSVSGSLVSQAVSGTMSGLLLSSTHGRGQIVAWDEACAHARWVWPQPTGVIIYRVFQFGFVQ